MPIEVDQTAPYAPPTTVIEFLTRHRNGGVPAPVTLSVLERLGVSESLRPRTLQALKLLDFIDEQGNPTEEFLNLRKVSTPEYPVKLAEMLRAAYADVFAVVEPSGATYQSVTDAFRGFKPLGQIDRMVTLFLGLLDHTQQWTDLPAARGSGSTGKATPLRRPMTEKAPTKGRPLVKRTPENPLTTHAGTTVSGETVTVDFGTAGKVVLQVNVKWLELPKDTFTNLRDLIDQLGALAAGRGSAPEDDEKEDGAS